MIGRSVLVLLWGATVALAQPWPVDRGSRLLVPSVPTRIVVQLDGIEQEAIVEPIAPFAPNAQIVVQRDMGIATLPVPTMRYYRGRLTNDPASLLIATVDRQRGRVGGFALSRGIMSLIGAGRTGRFYQRDLDHPPPGFSLENDVRTPPPRPHRLPTLAVTVPATATIAIETDHELWVKFGTDEETRDYIGALFAAVSSFYQRDIGVTLQIGYLKLWATTSDPWTATSTSDALDEVQSYWTTPSHGLTTVPRATTQFLSGKTVTGGIAWLNALCDLQYGYSVVQLGGTFDLSDPRAIWDVMVVAHELGHNFGSEHEHCYSPPLNACYNREQGCYSGSVACSRGAIMSYCHLCPGGLSNIDLLFMPAVVGHVLREVSAVHCLTPITASSTTTRPSTTTSPPTTTIVPTTTTHPPTTSVPSTTTTTTTTLANCKGPGSRCMRKKGCCSRVCVRPNRWQVRGVCQ